MTRKFQEGGQLQAIVEKVQEAAKGSPEALQFVLQVASDDETMGVIAENSPELAQAIAEIVTAVQGGEEEEGAEEPPLLDDEVPVSKRGGTLKKKKNNKIKKACKGRKFSAGGDVVLPRNAHGQTWSSSKQSTTVFAKGGKPCGCTKLHKVGGRIVETDCEGRLIPKNGFGSDFLGGLIDGVGTVAGGIARYGQGLYGGLREGWGHVQNAFGGDGRVNVAVGQALQRTAPQTYSKVNSAVDKFGADVSSAVRAVTHYTSPTLGYMWDKKYGYYDPNTGDRVDPNGAHHSEIITFDPQQKENQRTSWGPGREGTWGNSGYTYDKAIMLQKMLKAEGLYDGPIDGKFGPKSLEALEKHKANLADQTPGNGGNGGKGNSTPNVTTPEAEEVPVVKKEEPLKGKYYDYGVRYKKDDEGNVVEDWENSEATSQDVRRAVNAHNRAAGFDERAARRAAVPIGQRNAAYYQAQAQSRAKQRQARRDIKAWERGQRNASTAALLNDVEAAQYDQWGGILYRNGGAIDYGRWFN